MPNRDTPDFTPADLGLALSLLSRLPVKLSRSDPDRTMAQSAWAWPVVGVLVGLLAGFLGLTGHFLGAGPGMSAGITLAALVMATGALHEDGLADTFDGLWGGSDKSRRLEIMKDSHIGSYGVLALSLTTLLRWSLLTTLFQSGWVLAPVIAAAALSRVPMAVLLTTLPNARGSGLSATTGQPKASTILATIAIAALISIALTGTATLAAIFWISLTTIALASVAKAKIGGQTGDILGASQVLAELAALTCFVAIVT